MSKYNGVIRQITDDYNDDFFSDQPLRGNTADYYAVFIEDFQPAHTVWKTLFLEPYVCTICNDTMEFEHVKVPEAFNGWGLEGWMIRFKTTDLDAATAFIARAMTA